MQGLAGQGAEDGVAGVEALQRVDQVVGHLDEVADDVGACFRLPVAEHLVGDPKGQLRRRRMATKCK